MTREMSKTETPRPVATGPRRPDVWSSFRREVDTLFDNFFGSESIPSWAQAHFPRIVTGNGDVMVPDIDLKETAKDITIMVELPGLGEDDIDLKIADGMLTISGEKKYEKSEEKGDYHIMERRFGSFRRSFRLPESVDAEKVAAVFDKGVLNVTIPKRKEAVKAEKHIKIARK
jgi:HSP20 family protein